VRSEEKILDLIISTAQEDERIRAAVLNGSRANPNAPRDIFQDFDVIYLVTDVSAFKYNFTWIRRFGELMIMQMPEDMLDPPPKNDGHFVYLMQFTDGNRIDLGIYPLTRAIEVGNDSLSRVLIDKDGIIGTLSPANESGYFTVPPSTKAFSDCCNEFWWVCPYVAKGLWREEITYAKHMLDQILREQLFKMVGWYVGTKSGFRTNPGKFGKYLVRYLEPELWDLLLNTYSSAEYDETWGALFAMCSLFSLVATVVAEHLGFDYTLQMDRRVQTHLHHVRTLPKNASEMYC
jgi:aminoglycoside 6-adenylyltransferase